MSKNNTPKLNRTKVLISIFIMSLVYILCNISTASAANIVANGDFETSTDGWYLACCLNNYSAVRTNITAESGSYSLLVSNIKQDQSNYYIPSILPNTTYTFSYWYNSKLSSEMRVNWCEMDSSGIWITQDINNGVTTNSNSTWTNSTMTFKTQPNTTQMVIRIISDGTQSGYCYFDNLQINQTPQVTASTSGNGTGSAYVSGYTNYGDSATLAATPSTGSTFVGWQLNGSIVSNNPTYITSGIYNSSTYIAIFSLNDYVVSTNIAGTGSGTITGGGTYNYNTPVTLTATPSAGSQFINWKANGIQVSTNSNYTLNITTNTTYTANFIITIPSTPTNITSYAITDTTATISWTPVVGATSYKILSDNNLVGDTTLQYYNYTGLNQDELYTITVEANNSSGDSIPSTPITITTRSSALNVPTNLTASNITSTSATLTWSFITGATEYKIYNNDILIDTSNSASYQLAQLTPSTVYTLTVTDMNGIIESNQSDPLIVDSANNLNSITDNTDSLKTGLVLCSPDHTTYYDTRTNSEQPLTTAIISDATGLSSTATKKFIMWH